MYAGSIRPFKVSWTYDVVHHNTTFMCKCFRWLNPARQQEIVNLNCCYRDMSGQSQKILNLKTEYNLIDRNMFNEFKVAGVWLIRQGINIVVKHTRTDSYATSYKRSLVYLSHIVPIRIILTWAENIKIVNASSAVFAVEKATLYLAFCDFRSRRDKTHTIWIG